MNEQEVILRLKARLLDTIDANISANNIISELNGLLDLIVKKIGLSADSTNKVTQEQLMSRIDELVSVAEQGNNADVETDPV
ncbi:tail fiber assembly chaperone [Morganella phage vB_Mm5]